MTDPGFGGFSPLSLFAAGEAGAWYDPSDLSTLFQDSAGTTPVTAVEQPVGLMLDKRFGLVRGSELLTNAPIVGAGWTAGADGTYTHAGTSFSEVQYPIAVQAGSYYEVTVETSGAAGSTAVQVGAAGTQATLTANGLQTVRIPAGTTTVNAVRFISNVDGKIIRPVSARIIPGNHASQATTASKALWQTTYAAFDRFDDYLTAAAGGGGTTGILICAGLRAGGAGNARTIWSDRGTNTGYRLSINASNQLVLSAGNGSAHTEVLGPAITAGTDYVVMGWHDGTNLNVRAGLAAATSAAFATATAGTAGFTIGRDNGTASGLYGDRLYALCYRKNDTSTAAQRDNLTRYIANKSGVTL